MNRHPDNSTKAQHHERTAQALIMKLLAEADSQALPRDVMARNLLSAAIGCIIGQFGIETTRIMTSNYIEQIAEHPIDREPGTRRP